MRDAARLLVLVGLVLVLPSPVHAESRRTFYVLQMDVQEDDVGSASGDADWGLGAQVAIPMGTTQETLRLTAGLDAGNLESEMIPGGVGGFSSGLVATQDYMRLFGGIEVGRRLDARIRPHLGVSVALIRQDLQTFSLDTVSGEPIINRSDSDTRLGYDLSAGVGFRITTKIGLDLGLRGMRGFEIRVPNAAGSSTRLDRDYLQWYLGVTHQFDWPYRSGKPIVP